MCTGPRTRPGETLVPLSCTPLGVCPPSRSGLAGEAGTFSLMPSGILAARMLAFTSILLCGWLAAPDFRVSEWVELERVVDGDTLYVQRAGQTAKLRLLGVDTEERFHPGQPP